MLLYFLLFGLQAAAGGALYTHGRRANSTFATCQQISSAISSASNVYYPFSPEYDSAVRHYSAINSAKPVCTVYPGNANDVATILRELGTSRTPFGVKGGGHGTNPFTSSTEGVLIAMKRFNGISLDKSTGMMSLGAGLICDDVYSALEGTGRGFLGGTVSGLGVAGFTLGGGFGLAENQYGLAIDYVKQFELVTPQYQVLNINSNDHPDIFWALKGGFNNLGIVTKFLIETYPAPPAVWGGVQAYGEDSYDAIMGACSDFDLYNDDPKALVLCTHIYISPGVNLLTVYVFYNAPTPPPNVFANLTAVEPLLGSFVQSIIGPLVGGWETRSMSDLVKVYPVNLFAGRRITFNTATMRFITPGVISSLKGIIQKYSSEMLLHLGAVLNVDVSPTFSGIYNRSRPSAFPHDPENVWKPIELDLVWDNPASDDFFFDLARRMRNDIANAAIADGQDLSHAIVYPNTALGDTPLETMYGANVPRLRAITAAWDPQKVMTLAGGFKFQSP